MVVDLQRQVAERSIAHSFSVYSICNEVLQVLNSGLGTREKRMKTSFISLSLTGHK